MPEGRGPRSGPRHSAREAPHRRRAEEHHFRQRGDREAGRTIVLDFNYDGGGLGKGGNVTLYYDGDKAGEGRVQATQPLIFSADETTDIGEDFGMPVSSGYSGASRFNGKIDLVQIDIGDDNHDHLIKPEELIRIAMSRQ